MKILFQHTLIASVLTLLISSPQAAFSDSVYHHWQMQHLLQPSPKQLGQEQRGKIFIYDGLKDKEVDQVMKKQFDRIQSMMFIRTIITDDNGKPRHDKGSGKFLAEDDDC